MDRTIRKVLVIANLDKDDSAEVLQEMRSFFSGQTIDIVVYTFQRAITSTDLDDVDLAITLGGDGTLLYGSSFLSPRGIPILAVNLGHVGFITEISRDEWAHAYEQYACCRLGLSERIMVQVTVIRDDKQIFAASGLNDAVIGSQGVSRLIELKLLLASSEAGRYRADGLIVATPTGSTAYSIGAGGPILHPEMEALLLNPICPYTLSNRPLVVSAREDVEIVVQESRRADVMLTIDGQQTFSLEPGDRVRYRMDESKCLIIRSDKRNFYDVLRSKLHWAENRMLEELTVLNYALIDRVHVRFSGGLNILTGETGAGKSILVGALGLLLGQKTDTSVVRTGSDETVVTGVIRIAANPDATSWLADRSIEPEDGSIIIRRVVKRTGRGACYIQSTPVTRSDLAEIATVLFDYHGQHQHQSLLKIENHRRLLDRFGQNESLSDQVANLYSEWSAATERLGKLAADERERLREIDLLSHAVTEIDQAALAPDEEDLLEAEHKILANHERLFRLIDEVHGLVAESRQGALAALRKSREAMEEITRIDPGLTAPNNQLQDAFFEIEDFSETVRSYHSSVQFDPARLAAVESRLSQVRDLERKYGDTLVAVLNYRDESARQLESLENWEDEKQKLTDQIDNLESELRGLSQELSDRRKEAAGRLQDRVAQELTQLSMPKVRFRVVVQERGKDSQDPPPLGPTGIDLVEFVISTNLGEPFRRLRQIASGGELSRIMLAIKSVLVDSDHISTLIFDEVDTGVGGQVAISVGDRLQGLSQEKQILCITHLATIAVRADNHLRVEKVVAGQRTSTRVESVSDAARTEEISRMLSGDSTNQAALTHAEELIQRYSS